MCGHEWSGEQPEASDSEEPVIRDAVGNVLSDGDTVTLVKTVKVSGGGGGTVKIGTKVTGIRLNAGGVGGHDIDARVPGFGNMQLKSSVVKRVN
jgi:protein PhnA